MNIVSQRGALAAFALLFACRPELPLPTGEAASSSEVTVVIEPEPGELGVSSVLRLRVQGGARVGLTADDVVLVSGELGPTHLRDLAKDDPSKALQERFEPATTFIAGADLIVVPQRELELEESYSLGVGTLEISFPFEIEHRPRLLTRVWPEQTSSQLVACGDEPLADTSAEVVLEPDGPRGLLARGTPRGHAAQCVRFEPEEPKAGSFHLPVELSPGVALDPRPWTLETGEPEPIDAVACDGAEVAFGPGCAAVADDRLRVRGPEVPVLWVIAVEGGVEVAGRRADAHVEATRDGSSFMVRGLAPSSTLSVSLELLGERGGFRAFDESIVTQAPQPHFVLNEVYANPIGPEPGQEWVEIVNDGLAAGLLDGLVLVDVGGETSLPVGSGWLAAGAHALLVGAEYGETTGFDPPIAPGALLVTLPGTLGKNGLANAGEPLILRDGSSLELSRFPPSPKPKAGQSVARVRPDAPDDQEASFALAENPTPGAPQP